MGEGQLNPWEALVARLAPPRQMSGGKVDAQFIIDGLIRRGLPAHVAEGFALNAGEESGFDPGINEITPLVEGSRGGFGLFQWTGPRRRALEAFAAQRGVSPADPELQLDMIAQELRTTERRAASSIFATETSAQAAAAIVTDFLRPAPENRDRRVAKFLGGNAQPASQPAAFNFTDLFRQFSGTSQPAAQPASQPASQPAAFNFTDLFKNAANLTPQGKAI